VNIDIDLNTVKWVKVEEAISSGAFLPFTVLPEEYRGKTVALVIITDWMKFKQANELLNQTDIKEPL
jgi:hypothetical protein